MGFDKIHLKGDCKQGSIVNGSRERILYSFASDQPAVYKIYKESKVKLFNKINKSVLSLLQFYLEDDDHKPVVSNRETRFFTYHLNKI